MRDPVPCAVVFDCDGTLTPKGTSLFSVVDASALTPEANDLLQRLRARYLEKAVKGALTVDEETDWLVETLETYILGGLTPERARDALRGVRFRPGVKECFAWLRAEGVPTAIVSYGTTPFIEAALENNGMRDLVDRIYSSELGVSAAGRFCGYDPASLVLPSNKGEWSRRFADACGVRHENLIAVGDSGGDKTLGCRQELRIGIAKDDADAARISPFMGHVVITEDFGPVTDWLRRTMNLVR